MNTDEQRFNFSLAPLVVCPSPQPTPRKRGEGVSCVDFASFSLAPLVVCPSPQPSPRKRGEGVYGVRECRVDFVSFSLAPLAGGRAMRLDFLPRPACGERVGVRGI